MTSKIRILGCSGGIGSELRTTSLLLDDDILIDAGTGAADLSIDQLRKIDHIFVTHSHLDHIVSIPFIADAVGASRPGPVRIYGIRPTLDAISEHIFNDVIWPDFTKIPSIERPFVRLVPIELHQALAINQRTIVALPVNHSIPANAYSITSGLGNSLVFSGDTGASVEFWKCINELKQLKHLIIETSFNDSDEELAQISGHYSPQLLLQDIKQLEQRNLEIWITHLKPDGGESIYDEVLTRINENGDFAYPLPKKLNRGAVLNF